MVRNWRKKNHLEISNSRTIIALKQIKLITFTRVSIDSTNNIEFSNDSKLQFNFAHRASFICDYYYYYLIFHLFSSIHELYAPIAVWQYRQSLSKTRSIPKRQNKKKVRNFYWKEERKQRVSGNVVWALGRFGILWNFFKMSLTLFSSDVWKRRIFLYVFFFVFFAFDRINIWHVDAFS